MYNEQKPVELEWRFDSNWAHYESNYEQVRIYEDASNIYIQGLARYIGTTTPEGVSWSTIGFLPEHIKPKRRTVHNCAWRITTAPARVDIYADGTVAVVGHPDLLSRGAGWVSLDIVLPKGDLYV